MKKNIKMNALLLTLCASFASITFAPFEEPIETEHPNSETDGQRTERHKNEQKELSQKQEQERSTVANHLSKADSKNKSLQKKSINSITDATGVALDPTKPDFEAQKQSAKKALSEKHEQEKSNLNAQQDAENSLNSDADMFGDNPTEDSQDSQEPQDQATSEEIQSQRLMLNDASSMADDLDGFDFITDEEKTELREKIENVKQALKDRIVSKLKIAFDELRDLLAQLMKNAAKAKNKAGSTLREKINKLQDDFNEFIKNMNRQDSESGYSKSQEPAQKMRAKENALNELGLTGDPSWEEVEKSFNAKNRKLKTDAFYAHPDKGGDQEQSKLINAKRTDLNDAYKALKEIYKVNETYGNNQG